MKKILLSLLVICFIATFSFAEVNRVKNVAIKLIAHMRDSSGAPVTGATVSCWYSGYTYSATPGSYQPLNVVPTEMDEGVTTNVTGDYAFAVSNTITTNRFLAFRCTAPGAIPWTESVSTELQPLARH